MDRLRWSSKGIDGGNEIAASEYGTTGLRSLKNGSKSLQ